LEQPPTTLVYQKSDRENMGDKAEEFRAKARELEERAQSVIDPTARLTLLDVAQRWRTMARRIDQDGSNATTIPNSSKNTD
jgi:Family of unknown function (DUF6381)